MILAVFFAAFIGFHLYKYKKMIDITEVAQSFHDYCRIHGICDLSPRQWQYSQSGVFLGSELMMYKVSDDKRSFVLEQKIAPSVTLVVTAGVDMPLEVETILD